MFLASAYEEGLGKVFKTPQLAQGNRSAWAQYTRLVEDRDAVRAKLTALGVPSVVYYPKALTQQDGYSSFPVVSPGVAISEALTDKVLTLPMHRYLEIEKITALSAALLKI